MRRRGPGILAEVKALNPDYPPHILAHLDQLSAEISSGALLLPPELPSPDADEWLAEYNLRRGETWLSTPWFFAETYFYHSLLQVVHWWDTGRDPFAPKKAEELASPGLWKMLNQALSLNEPLETLISELMLLSLWGNRVDLSYAVGTAHGHVGDHSDILANDLDKTVEHLLRSPGAVHIVADNTGTELATDLALIDVLLNAPPVNNTERRVFYHVKMNPMFVSDTLAQDVHALLKACQTQSEPVRALASRLNTSLLNGKLRLAPDFYWNSSRFIWDLPPRLRDSFKSAALVIFKGDANYRRIIGDAIWPEGVPFSDAVAGFPAPMLALRTMKSDPLVGVPVGTAAELDPVDPKWRLNAKRAVMQFYRPD